MTTATNGHLPPEALALLREGLIRHLRPADLSPFNRTKEREEKIRSTIHRLLVEQGTVVPTDERVQGAMSQLFGFGPLQPLVEDGEVSDILVNGPDNVWVERRGRLTQTDVRFSSEKELRALADWIVATFTGRGLSIAHPLVDARLLDGSRVNAVVPPVGGPYISIRKFNHLWLDLLPGGTHDKDWVTEGGLSMPMAEHLVATVQARANTLVAGSTGAGKTTFLRSLAGYFDPNERIGVCEDTAELGLETPNQFHLEAVHPNEISGDAEQRTLDVGDLVANSLRMRPDRLIVGEIRQSKDVHFVLRALHTGHDGSATTIHASSAEEALFMMELLARQAMKDMTTPDLRAYIAHAFDQIVVMRRLDTGVRVIREIASINGVGPDGQYNLTTVFRATRDHETNEIEFEQVGEPDFSPRVRARFELDAERAQLLSGVSSVRNREEIDA